VELAATLVTTHHVVAALVLLLPDSSHEFITVEPALSLEK
jgi:hypothetical protein